MCTCIEIRPYQIMCLICRLGRQNSEPYYFEGKLDSIQTTIAKNRDCIIKLSCDVESTFRFQNPGGSLDTPEGKSFNLRRDLTVLQRLGLLPGAKIPASDLIRFITRNGNGILTCSNICTFPTITSSEWQGCRYGASNNYERGVKVALAQLISARTLTERQCCKQKTATEMYERKLIKISPHHLLCMACFVGKNKANEYSPILDDNLYEAIETCRQHPETIVELIAGPCMICDPCSGFYPDTGFCAMGFAMGLRNQKKDLDTLQFMGLDYGVKMRADKLFKLMFERIKDKKDICGYNTNIQTHEAWSICPGLGGSDGFQNYRDAGKHNLGMEK